jgi:hypothetical protein
MTDYERKMRNAGMLCFIAALVLALVWTSAGCTGKKAADPVGASSILSTTDRLYTSIKIVVTDPEVRLLFSNKDMETLAQLEKQYLAATDTLRKNPDDAETIEVIVGVATDLLAVINGVAYTEKYRPAVTAIRISLNLLRSRLGA